LFIPTRIEPRFLGGTDCSLVIAFSRFIYLTLPMSLSLDSIFYVVVENIRFIPTRIEPRFLGDTDCSLVIAFSRFIYLAVPMSLSLDSIFYVVVTWKK
jgi:hypothetical protein